MAVASDVVIVGGGIAGASLACALARDGLGVTLLEASVEYQDRVRGESMVPWGVREARTLGVEDVLLDAGAHVATAWDRYAEGIGARSPLPVGMILEGVSGSLNLRHPDACQALLDAATAAGATAIRGVRDVRLVAGSPVTVSYTAGTGTAEVTAPLVVGADGRQSVVRRQVGIELQRQAPIGYIAGLLLAGLDGVPDEHDAVVSEGDVMMLMFLQGHGRGRTYVCTGLSGQHRFAGPEGTSRFLDAWDVGCYPWARDVRAATPAGPCATYPGDDTWTDTPYADGVVLIGDAAGWNDPIVGQGLSIAMRDARTVRDLVIDGARRPPDFTPYGRERLGRMERARLGADVMAVTQVEDADNREARRAFVFERMDRMDPEVFPLFIGLFAGPETVPDEAVDPGLLDRIRAAG